MQQPVFAIRCQIVAGASARMKKRTNGVTLIFDGMVDFDSDNPTDLFVTVYQD